MNNQPGQIYEFGDFQMDVAERVLRRGGKPVPLTPKALEVLLLLIENSGRIVETSTLMNRVWRDSFVEENNLKVTISMLRKILGKGDDQNDYIETVPRRGYRFVAEVREVVGQAAPATVALRIDPAALAISPRVKTIALLPFKFLSPAFAAMMHAHSVGPAGAWVGKLDLSRYHMMLDVGGGSAAHALAATGRWSNLRATVFDLPSVCQWAQQYIARSGLQHRVRTAAGDMWQDQFPPADLHFYSDIFHDWPPEKCLALAQKSFASLESGGRIIIHEMLLSDDKTAPFAVAASAIAMLVWSEGQQYSGRELGEMLAEVGFVAVEVLPTFGYWQVVTGIKP